MNINEGMSYSEFMEMFNLPPAGDWIKFRRDGPGKKPDRKPQPYRIKNTKGKRLPSSKKEHMDFTEFTNSAVHPLYEKEGAVPKCPPGYRFDKEMMMCVPKTPKDAVGQSKYGNKDLKPGQGPHYNVFGNSGYSGAGYAFEEPPTTNDIYSGQNEGYTLTAKDYERYDQEEKDFKKADARMKYGKAGKPTDLHRGEVRKPRSRK